MKPDNTHLKFLYEAYERQHKVQYGGSTIPLLSYEEWLESNVIKLLKQEEETAKFKASIREFFK